MKLEPTRHNWGELLNAGIFAIENYLLDTANFLLQMENFHMVFFVYPGKGSVFDIKISYLLYIYIPVDISYFLFIYLFFRE